MLGSNPSTWAVIFVKDVPSMVVMMVWSEGNASEVEHLNPYSLMAFVLPEIFPFSVAEVLAMLVAPLFDSMGANNSSVGFSSEQLNAKTAMIIAEQME